MDLKDHACAMLALQLTTANNRDGVDTVSDSELVKLCEGRQDESERARLINIIAHDQAVYQRWLTIVESIQASLPTELLEAVAPAEKTSRHGFPAAQATLDTLVGYWQKFLSWIRPVAFPAGAFALTATLIVYMTGGAPDYEADLQRLYNDYGNELGLAQSNVEVLPHRSAQLPLGDLQPQSYSPAKTALAKGILAGADTLGDSAMLPNIVIDQQKFNDQNQEPESHQQALHSLGRLVALLSVYCADSGSEEFFARAGAIYLPLYNQLSEANIDEVKVMYMLHDQETSQSYNPSGEDMCVLNASVLNQFGA